MGRRLWSRVSLKGGFGCPPGRLTIYLHELLACRRMSLADVVSISIVARVGSAFRGFLGANLLTDEVAEPGRDRLVSN